MVKFAAQPWIGVDFDGTLVEYHGWAGWNSFGKPIPAMVERVRAWLDEGKDVRIFTARVGLVLGEVMKCRHTGQSFTNHMMVKEIQDWTEQHVGACLPVTCVKDLWMTELWDDRAVGMQINTGLTLVEAALPIIDAASELYAAFVSQEHPTNGQVEAMKTFAEASNKFFSAK